MNHLFPPELRTAAVVPRWTVVRTLNRDNIAIHSYFVTFYALQVARLIGWAGPVSDLMFVAMMHDMEETITGDQVSPVKREIIDENKAAKYISDQMKARLPLIELQLDDIMGGMWGTSIERIIKVADKVDACIFLITEQRMGNTVLEPLFNDAVKNLRQAWEDLGKEVYEGDEQLQNHEETWLREVWPAIQVHWKHGGVGVGV